MTALTQTAAGRWAVPAMASPILSAFIDEPSAPRSAMTSAAMSAGRRRDAGRARAAQTSRGMPTNAGMSAVTLTAEVSA